MSDKKNEELLAENENLRLRLEEAEETLRAIGSGEVDAFVVSGADGDQQIFTLKGADQPYRVLVESMSEGAATLSADGTILYCNKRVAELLNAPQESLVGSSLGSYIASTDQPMYSAMLHECTLKHMTNEMTIITGKEEAVPVFFSCCAHNYAGNTVLSMVITDLTQQKRNEAILASENFSTSIVEQASEAIIVCDRNGQVIRASHSAHNLCGTNPLLKMFSKLFRLTFAQSDKLFSLSAHLRQDSLKSLEVKFKRNDGQTFNLLLNATNLKSVQNTDIGSIVTLTDITVRKQMENALHHHTRELEQLWVITKKSEAVLRESEYRLNLFIEFAPAGLAMFDRDMKYLYVSEHWCNDYGLKSNDLIGRSHYDVFPEISDQWKETYRRGMAGEVLSAEADRFERADGSIKWLRWGIRPWHDSDGFVGGIVIFAEDITNQKHADEEARQLNEIIAQEKDRLSALVNSITDEIWFADTTGAFTLVNPKGRQEFVLGYGGAIDVRELAVGLEVLQPDGTLRPPEESPPLRALRGEFVQNQEELVRTPSSGDLRYRQVNAAPVRDYKGSIIGSVSVVRDITELKRVEGQIKASLAEKEVLLKEIHHRVKNNLQVISSLVSLQADGLKDEVVGQVLKDVTYRLRSMSLVHEKLYQSSDLAHIDFAEYTRSLLSYLWLAHGAFAADVRMTLDLGPVSFLVDTAVTCGLILNELAVNALKHAFQGRSDGEVKVSLHCGADRRISLCVTDNGVGLPVGFDWRQTQSLGLRLVQMLSRQLDATAEVSSGDGTKFEIIFENPASSPS